MSTRRICDRCGKTISESPDYTQTKLKSIKIVMTSGMPPQCCEYDLCSECEDTVMAVLEPLPQKSDIIYTGCIPPLDSQNIYYELYSTPLEEIESGKGLRRIYKRKTGDR